MEYQERMEKAFQMAMETGIDYFLGMGSVLVAMGEAFSKRSGNLSASRGMLKPAALARAGESDGEMKIARGAAAAEALLESEGHHGGRASLDAEFIENGSKLSGVRTS